MNTEILWVASGLALLTFGVHTFVGGKVVARPLLADRSLPRASKWLNYFCWHVVTLLLAAMTVALGYSAATGQGTELAAFLGLLSIGCSALSAGVALRAGINPLRFPSTSLFFAVAVAVAAAFLFA